MSGIQYWGQGLAFESATGQSRRLVTGVISTYANGGRGTAMRAVGLIGRQRETGALAEFIDDVRSGRSRVLVLRGECGIGKTALLDWVVEQADDCQVLRAAGVEAEMELAFAGLHQLLAPALPRLDSLPPPQRDALQMTFGIRAGATPDRFFIALAVLSLLADTAARRPLICLIDDEQWLDRASAQALAFVARRLGTESVGLIFATLVATDELSGLPELHLEGLDWATAGALLDSALTAPLDPAMRERFLIETRGNPLALSELPRSVTPAELAGGFAAPAVMPMSDRLEDGFRRRLDALPAATRRLVQLAAADPVGDPSLLWNAAARLGIDAGAAAPAIEAGLIDIDTRVKFRHPLVRSAAYRSASVAEKQDAHRALAEATDPRADPERRAWHRAQATPGPDETVATELENSAGRALARGGVAAAAAFLERAAMLTPAPGRRAATVAGRGEGQAGRRRARRRARAIGREWRPGRSTHCKPRRWNTSEGRSPSTNCACATRLDCCKARPGVLKHCAPSRPARLVCERWMPPCGWRVPTVRTRAASCATAAAALAGPPSPRPPRAVDVLLDAFVAALHRGLRGRCAAVQSRDRDAARRGRRRRSSRQLVAHHPLQDQRHPGRRGMGRTDSWYALALRETQFARMTGAPIHLQFALHYLAWTLMLRGEFDEGGRA